LKSLYLRIWLTVIAVLALFALGAGALMQRHLQQERERYDRVFDERLEGWSELVTRSLPEADAPRHEQAAALTEWSKRLRMPMALDDAAGARIAASESFARRADDETKSRRLLPIRLPDGRTLWVARGAARRLGAAAEGAAAVKPADAMPRRIWEPAYWQRAWPDAWPPGLALAALLLGLFVAVAASAYPVVRRLTRRLEALKQGVDAFGAGALSERVATEGNDEVAALAASFNEAAARIEALLRSHRDLLANASHELRSPLARLKIAVEMLQTADGERRDALKTEIDTNVAELDALIDEVLLSSRLEAQMTIELDEPVDLLALAIEEAARLQAEVSGPRLLVRGSERLLRRALRNLLENARRYGGDAVRVEVGSDDDGAVFLRVCDNGDGVPPDQRERIFEAFYRLPGHAERDGGTGLGLALVRQIAERHGGQARCIDAGGGGCFVISLPAGRRIAP
jgi:signal transduction histidine kinase